MMRTTLLWITALLITLGSAYYQRTTGPSYPVEGSVSFAGTAVTYTLTRTHGGAGDQEVPIIAPDTRIRGRLVWRRYKTNDAWTGIAMERQGDKLIGLLPHQPPAGKLEYYAELTSAGSQRLVLPQTGGSVVTRFRGDVPGMVLIPHIVLMFIAMLFSTRAGLEALSASGKPRTLTLWTLGTFAIGGLILGPIVQKFAFDAYWTGFPLGTDLTDTKTLIAFTGWLVAAAAVWVPGWPVTHPNRRWWIVLAAALMLAVYLIPHSMMGSELDYSKLDKPEQGAALYSQ